jgi:hypothetical protein
MKKHSFTRYIVAAVAVVCMATALLVFPVVLWSQTRLNLQHQSRRVDFSNADTTKPAKIGAALPPTCQTGEVFLLIPALPGSNLFVCVANNVWTLQTGIPPSPPDRGQILTTDDSGGYEWSSFSGDVTGGGSTTKVTGIQNRPVADVQPASGQTLVWNAVSRQWEPGANGGVTTKAVQSGRYLRCRDASSTDAYACIMNPVPASYVTSAPILDGEIGEGTMVLFRPATENTGAATLQIGDLPAKPIKQTDGATDPTDGQLIAGRWYTLTYDGAVWQITSGSGGISGVSGGLTVAGSTASVNTAIIPTHVDIQTGDDVNVTTYGTAPAYIANMKQCITAFTDRMRLRLYPHMAGDGSAVTLDFTPCGLSSKNLYAADGESAPATDDLATTGVDIQYDANLDNGAGAFRLRSNGIGSVGFGFSLTSGIPAVDTKLIPTHTVIQSGSDLNVTTGGTAPAYIAVMEHCITDFTNLMRLRLYPHAAGTGAAATLDFSTCNLGIKNLYASDGVSAPSASDLPTTGVDIQYESTLASGAGAFRIRSNGIGSLGFGLSLASGTPAVDTKLIPTHTVIQSGSDLNVTTGGTAPAYIAVMEHCISDFTNLMRLRLYPHAAGTGAAATLDFSTCNLGIKNLYASDGVSAPSALDLPTAGVDIQYESALASGAGAFRIRPSGTTYSAGTGVGISGSTIGILSSYTDSLSYALGPQVSGKVVRAVIPYTTGSPGTLQGFGATLTSAGSGSTSIVPPTSTSGQRWACAVSAAANSFFQCYSPTTFFSAWNPEIRTNVAVTQPASGTDWGMWIGATWSATSALITSTEPNGPFIGFRYSPVLNDTEWKCISKGQSGSTKVRSSTIAFSNGAPVNFAYTLSSSGEGRWYINGSEVCAGDPITGIPSTSELFHKMIMGNANSAALPMSFSTTGYYQKADN